MTGHIIMTLTPAVHMVAGDFCVTNTKSDDALTISVMKEKPLQTTVVTVMHNMSFVEFAVITCICGAEHEKNR